MAIIVEQEQFCKTCGSTAPIPVCCCSQMDYDGSVFFCTVCNKERKAASCCSGAMQIRNKVKKLKNEIFRTSIC